MAKITVNKDKCKGCLLCVSFCPKGLLKINEGLNKKGSRYMKFEGTQECLGCAMCAIICPDCCIEVWK